MVVGFIGRISIGYFSDAVKTYAFYVVNNYTVSLVDESVTEGVIDHLNEKSLLKESYDSNGKVSYAYLDTKKINTIRTETSVFVKEAIDRINTHEDFNNIEIPLGYFLGRNYFLSNGIKVPIDLEVIGQEFIEIKSNVESHGINTTILSINLHINVEIQIVIPMQAERIVTENIIPLSLEIINNDIPYYLGDIL